MITITVLSQKGGTGKTTTVRTLTDIFRRAGLKVLAVDLDPQGNLSDYLGVAPDASPSIGDVLAGRARLADAVHDGIVPANLGLAEAELVLGGKLGRELMLKRALQEVGDAYDLIMIDCPPALGLLTVNALVASEYALLSAEAQYFALQGVEQALEVIELARDSLNPRLQWLGVLLNIADMRTRHSREAFESLREHYGEKLSGHDDPRVDRLRRVGRAGDLDPRLPARSRRRLPERRRRAAAPARARRSARRPRCVRRRRALAGSTRSRRRLRGGDGQASRAARPVYAGALALERRAHDPRPSRRLRRQRLHDGPRALAMAPHEHGGSGAGDGRAERAEPRARSSSSAERGYRWRGTAGGGGRAGPRRSARSPPARARASAWRPPRR